MFSNFIVGFSDRKKEAMVHAELMRPSASGETFSESHLEGLPAPAVRYLRRAIAPGTPIPERLEFDFEGHCRSGTGNGRSPLSGSGGLIVPRQGFLWREDSRRLGIPKKGCLYYCNGHGEVHWSWLGMIGIAKKRGAGGNTTRAMRHRMTSHLLWTPWAFLPNEGARWEAVDERTATVYKMRDDEQVEMTIEVDAEGRLVEAIHPRWGAKTKDGSFEFFPYGIVPSGEVTFGGFTVPSPMDLYWCYKMEERKPPLIFHYKLSRAEFR